MIQAQIMASSVSLASNDADQLQPSNYSVIEFTAQSADFNTSTTGLETEVARGASASSLESWHIVLICLGVCLLIVLTVVGNLLVLISFKVEKRLQTVSNYYLLSLAVADLMIGVVSMPLYTMFLLLGYWPLGTVMCDIWLSLDYTMSNASVANLLIICLDRYLSVTRPLTYMASRTPRRAAIMIGCAWTVSVLLWAPWIILWPYIEGRRTVPKDACYVQFLHTSTQAKNQIASIVTSLAAFYLPVTVMVVLYYRIFLETRKRQKELLSLQGNTSTLKKLLAATDEDLANDSLSYSIGHRVTSCIKTCCAIDEYDDLDSAEVSEAANSADSPAIACESMCSRYNSVSRVNSNNSTVSKREVGSRQASFYKALSAKNNHSSKLRTPSQRSIQTKEILECITTSFNERIPTPIHRAKDQSQLSVEETVDCNLGCVETTPTKLSEVTTASISADTPPSVLDRLHDKPISRTGSSNNHHSNNALDPSSVSSTRSKHSSLRSWRSSSNNTSRRNVLNRRNKLLSERRAESKAARTLSAILLAFICTWSPYMIFTLINTFDQKVIPDVLYNIGYWLCYINSTINPLCYAMCNAAFRQTFAKLLKCDKIRPSDLRGAAPRALRRY